MQVCHSLYKKNPFLVITGVNTERKVTPEVLISTTITLILGAMLQILCKRISSVELCITSHKCMKTDQRKELGYFVGLVGGV